MQQVQDTLPIGSIVRDRYEVQDLLGKGGFGAVYLVKDRRVRGNLFALKEVIDPHKKERERFLFEGEVLKRLDHTALPRVYRAFENDSSGRAYILMDYVEGSNLELLRKKQPAKRFSLAQVLAMMDPVVDAISFLHQQNPPIIHRDIKPANIILPPTGNETVLVDFGIAKEYDPESTTTAVRRYSPGYGAPEQYSSGTDTRTDIYGLAATIYTLLTGVVPAEALFRMTRMGANGSDPIEPIDQLVPGFPPDAAAVISKGMEVNSKDRYPSIEAFWQALKAAAPKDEPFVPLVLPVVAPSGPEELTTPVVEKDTTGDPISRPPLPPRERERERERRRWLPVAAILLVLLALGSGIAFAWFSMSHSKDSPQAAATATTAPPKATATATATATPKPTVAPTATPAPRNPPAAQGGYPTVAGSYSGTIHNTPANVDSSMALNVRQNNSSISGDVTLGPGLLGSGPFTGSVGQNKSIRFTDPVSGHATLLFTGTVAGDGSMNGSYCSLNSNNACDNNAGGYGTWQLNAPNGGTGS